jgi:hypothetical protein
LDCWDLSAESWSETARGKGEFKNHPNIINIADERKKKHLETFGSFLISAHFPADYSNSALVSYYLIFRISKDLSSKARGPGPFYRTQKSYNSFIDETNNY